MIGGCNPPATERTMSHDINNSGTVSNPFPHWTKIIIKIFIIYYGIILSQLSSSICCTVNILTVHFRLLYVGANVLIKDCIAGRQLLLWERANVNTEWPCDTHMYNHQILYNKALPPRSRRLYVYLNVFNFKITKPIHEESLDAGSIKVSYLTRIHLIQANRYYKNVRNVNNKYGAVQEN